MDLRRLVRGWTDRVGRAVVGVAGRMRRSTGVRRLLVAIVAAGVVGLTVAIAVLINRDLRGLDDFGALNDLDDVVLDLNFEDDCDRVHDPLIEAATRGRKREVESQLDEGADPNRRADGETALGCAAHRGHVEVVEVLLDAGARPGSDPLGRGALSSALCGDPGGDDDGQAREEIPRMLLEAGADPDGRRPRGPSPLLCTAWSGQAALVDLLLDHGADPDYGGRVGAALVVMAQSTSPGTPGGTVDDQAASVLPTPRGEWVDNVPPLVGAAWEGHVDIAARLLEAGADPNLASDEAFTPIFAAAVRGHREMVELLLAHGAAPVPQVRPGVPTPAEAARLTGHDDVAAVIEAAQAVTG